MGKQNKSHLVGCCVVLCCVVEADERSVRVVQTDQWSVLNDCGRVEVVVGQLQRFKLLDVSWHGDTRKYNTGEA